ncbi:MAG: hypothetical protein ABIJ16_08190, partial [Bacteroidota bacterium]
IVLTGFIFSVTYAQEGGDDEFLSKRGLKILPEAGDIGLGVNGIPIISYFGNTFNGTAFNTSSFNFVDGTNTIYGKYFLDESSAVRAKIRIAHNKVTDMEYIMKDTVPIPDPFVQVKDYEYTTTSNITLSVGYEMRRGKGRVQGFYGGEFMFNYASGNTKYEYGNGYGPDNTNPFTTNFGSNVTASGRTLEQINGKTLGAGLGGFIGVEYFFAPKISVGGEFGWGFLFNKTGDGEVTEEQWDGLQIQEIETQTGGGKNFNLDTDNAFGAIYLMFHF